VVQISGQNSKFCQFWGLYSHIFAPINVKFGAGSSDPLPRAKFDVSTLRGKKPIFEPLSKSNIAMAALRASLPVIIKFL